MSSLPSDRAAFDAAYRQWKDAHDVFTAKMNRAHQGGPFDEAELRRDCERLQRLYDEYIEHSKRWVRWR
jgi:hypothetical protein